MPSTYERRIALLQTGYSNGPGDWNEVAVGSNVAFRTNERVGLLFSFQTTGSASDIGAGFTVDSSMTPPRGLDAPIVVEFGTFPLDITITSLAITYDVLLDTDPACGLFSASDTPDDRTTTTLITGANLLPGGGAEDQTLTDAVAATVRALVTGRAHWNGRLAVILEPTSGGPAELHEMDDVLWSVTLMQSFTGLAGGPAGRGVRAVRDGRFGMGAFTGELQRDGDNPSLWVRGHDYDPEDEIANYRPKPGEGAVDDEVADL